MADDDDESRRQTAREVMREGVKEIDAPPSASEFFAEHVLRNRPLVVRGAASQWPAIAWSAARLSDAHGEEIVKVAPLEVSGPNAHLDKWLEPSEAWQHEEHEYCCDAHQLLVVSALRVKMRLRTFFKRLSAPDSVSFYADGAGNLDHSFSFLRDDFAPPPFAQQLHLKRADLWMGGKSISRMHYDNLDNVCALRKPARPGREGNAFARRRAYTRTPARSHAQAAACFTRRCSITVASTGRRCASCRPSR